MAIKSSGKLLNTGGTAASLYVLMRDYMCSRNGAGGDFTTTGLGFEYYDDNFTNEDTPTVGQHYCTRHVVNGCTFYCKWEYESTVKLKFNVHLGWNLSTHQPVGAYLVNKEFFDNYADNCDAIYIVGDDTTDLFVNMVMYNNIANSWDYAFFGMPQNGDFGNVLNMRLVTAGATAGSSVTLTLGGAGLPDEFVNGAYVLIAGLSGTIAKHEAALITSVDAATPSVTVDLVNSYTDNMMVGTCLAWYAIDSRDNGTTCSIGICNSSLTVTPVSAVNVNAAYTAGQAYGYNPVTAKHYMQQMPIVAASIPLCVVPDVLAASAFNATNSIDEEVIDVDGDSYRAFKSYAAALWLKEA